MWKDDFIDLLFPTDPQKMKIEEAMILKSENIPKSLFKYKSFDEKGYALKMLEDDLIWLSSPEKFNDPYDCALTFATKKPGNLTRDIITSLLERLPAEYKFSDEEVEFPVNSDKFTYDFAKKYPKANEMMPDNYAEIISKAVDKKLEHIVNKLSTASRNGLFITCFSETNKSILMWSHYAANHTGFCVEYDFSKLSSKDLRKRLLYPVIYDNNMFDATEYLQPTFEDKSFNNLMLNFAAMNKSNEWSYEREWRFILPYGPTKEILTLNAPKPVAIYLSAKISVEDKKKVLDIGESRGIRIYQMSMAASSFNLTITNS